MERHRLYSFAKINLYLDCPGKREDGFHEIRSIFQTVSLCDEIDVEASDVFSFHMSDKSASHIDRKLLSQNNLLEKIYYYFQEKFLIENIKITLNKQIPVGGGLGGGSSNGATLIDFFNKEYSLGLSIEKKKEIGALFGSDIPFFLKEELLVLRGLVIE